jgi:hypothetical protein
VNRDERENTVRILARGLRRAQREGRIRRGVLRETANARFVADGADDQRTVMNPDVPHKLPRSVGAAATSVMVLLVLQAALGLALAAARPDTVPATVRHAAVASALLATLALFARARVRTEPALSAGIVAALLGAEAVGLAVLVGVPAMPAVLRVTFVCLVYGGLTLLAMAALCAAFELKATRVPLVRALRPSRRPLRGSGRAA